MAIVTRPGEYFHPHRIADRDLAFEQRLDAIAGLGPGVSKKLDPRGRIDQNHVERLVRISPRSPSQPGPPKLASFINPEGLGRKSSKRKVDRLAFCRQTVTAHDRRARLIVDIHVSA